MEKENTQTDPIVTAAIIHYIQNLSNAILAGMEIGGLI